MGRPRGHSPSNKGRANWSLREPSRAALPLVRELFERIDETGVSLGAFGKRCGYNRASLSQWRHGCVLPVLPALVDMGEAAGYRLAWVPLSDSSGMTPDTGRQADNKPE